MRLLLVGSPAERARLRSGTHGALDVVGEFDSLTAARASAIDSDAILMPNGVRLGSDPNPTPFRPRSGVRLGSDPNPTPFEELLTGREVQVLELLAEGLPNKAIAVRLRISDQTVKFHVSSISGKLGAKNRTDAVRRALRQGLITL
ncbi:MAG: response regulator containing a CheY-like receiver domain and an DNA-binding domain [Acidobacteria bacterium]|nr:response regulator containing a CheY-like receiver domain and an DNA-binding domain [Acidobacteriota bacterium]